MSERPSLNRNIYQPPRPAAGWRWVSLSAGFVLACAVFLTLPLTQMFAKTGEPAPPMQTVAAFTPPEPPPPQPKPKEQPPPDRAAAADKPKPRLEKPQKPITLRQLEIALNPQMADAIRGDFDFDFNMTAGPVISNFKVFELAEVDEPPVPVARVPAVYPRSLRRSRIDGQAVIRFIVDESGATRDARAIESTHPAFATAAIAAVNRSRFKPSKKGGKAVPVWVQAPYRFKAPRK
jgi:protein TonB